MFEYKGGQYTYEDLQAEAEKQGVDFAEFMGKMKNLGMTSVKDTSEGQGLNLDMSSQQSFEQEQPGVEINEDDAWYTKTLKVTDDWSAKTIGGFVNYLKGVGEYGGALEISASDWWASNSGETEQEGIDRRAAIEEKHSQGILGLLEPVSNFFEESEIKAEGGITENIENGNYLEAGRLTVGAALESIPSFISAAYGFGGFATLAISTAGNKWDEEFQNDGEAGSGKLLLNATGSGVIESTFELATRGLLKRAGIINAGGNAKAAKEVIEGGVTKMLANIGLGIGGEGLSEGSTELTSLLWDKLTLGREINWDEAIYQIADAGIVGSFVGSTTSTFGEYVKSTPKAKERAISILTHPVISKKIKEHADNINKLTGDLAISSKAGKKLIVKKINKEILEIQGLRGRSEQGLLNLNGVEMQQYATNVKQAYELNSILKSEKESDSAKKEAQIELDALTKSNLHMLDVSSERTLDANLAIAKDADAKIGLEQIIIPTDAEFAALPQGESGADGFISDGKVYINREIASKLASVSVGSHELLHGVVAGHLLGSDGLVTKNGIEFIDDMRNRMSSKEKAIVEKRIEDNYKYERDSEGNKTRTKDKNEYYDEYLNVFHDAIVKKQITYNPAIEKIGQVFSKMFRTKGFDNVKFNNGKDVYNFVKTYSKDILKNKVSKETIAFAKPTTSKVVKKSVSKDQTNSVNELAEMGWTNKTWKESGADFAIKEMQANKMLDGLILAQPHVDIDNDTFVNTTYAELLPHIRNYKPDSKNESGLFGWVNPQIGNKAKQAYNAITKNELKYTKEIGETTKEGEVKIQVEADIDASMEALETEDLSIAGQAKKKAEKAKSEEKVESKFRREIGIETGSDLYNKVLDTARKSLLRAYEAGTSVRNIQRKLRDEANVYLFKDIKNFLGTTKYISNLKEFRVPIMNSIFTADLVQMERNTPEGERVFTRFVRKLTSKADVQAAVDQNLLPVSALNIIDKGTAVSLYEKANPTEARFMSYFDIPTINPKTGARSGTRGTRKDQLAKNMAGALSYDATMEVAQEPEVAQKRADLAELRGESLLADDISQLAAAINRNPSVKFSYSQKQFDQGISIIEGNNKNDGFGGVNWNNFFNNPDISNDTKNAAQEAYVQRLTEQNDAISNKDLAKYDFTDPKRNGSYTGKPRKRKLATSKKYELYAKEKMQEALKNAGLDSKVYKVEKLSEKDNNPDIRVTRSGKTIFTVEIKGNTARGVSVSFNYKQDGKGLAKNKKAASKNETSNYLNEESSLIKTTNKVFEKMINLVGEDNVIYTNQKNLQISVEGVKKIKEAGLQLLVHKNQGFITTADFVNSYKEKKGKDGGSRTSNAIDIGNAGMFLMDSNSEMKIEGLKSLVDQKVLIPLTARISFNLNTAKTHYTVSVRVEPQINSLLFDKQNVSLINQSGNKNINFKFSKSQGDVVAQNILKAGKRATTVVHFSKTNGASIFDFDETVGVSENFIIAKKGDITEKIASDEWPLVGETLREQGYEFDFTDFNKVTKGKPGPLLQKMKNQIEKYGSKNVFILTARAPESQTAIHEWLESEGVVIPVENITGLGNSTSEAKAAWVLNKYANENYNDIYFVDDALQNVKAVKNMLDQLDIKGKSVQARVKFSKSMDPAFNEMLERTTGVPADQVISQARATKRGGKKGRLELFVPPSAEDFLGLLYKFAGKGEQGNADLAFLKQSLIDPLNRAYTELNETKQAIADDYRSLKKLDPETAKKLREQSPDADFTYGDAVRVYLWNKSGIEVPGLSETDQNTLTEMVTSDPKLQQFADQLGLVSRQEAGYVTPGEYWQVGDIRNDLDDATSKIGRKQFFTEFIENADIIFSQENLQKIEAIYGSNFREALENILYRTKTGSNKNTGSGRIESGFIKWINGSVAATMFVNTRSALLQTLSSVNFTNWGDNNPYKMAKAFANQPQFWSDFSMLFNSAKLKQRRSGLGMDINANELTTYMAKSKSSPKALLNWLLQKGFLPTQMADSFAISIGGASFYRNRVNTYLKQGMDTKQAEAKAFQDFSEIAEATQQSARPDMVSQQQASPLGKFILNFQNTPMQYTRLIKKATIDLVKGRGDIKTNISRIIYYGAVQNMIFYGLQTALFAMMFSDDEKDEEFFKKKQQRVANGMVDSLLRGTGIGGAAVATAKNMIIAFIEKRNSKAYKKSDSAILIQFLNFSPVVGIKSQKILSADKQYDWNEKVIDHMNTFDINNPVWSSVSSVVEGVTNVPLNRLHKKVSNVRAGLDAENEAWQRLSTLLGFSTWEVGIENREIDTIKAELKEMNKSKKKKKSKKNRFGPTVF